MNSIQLLTTINEFYDKAFNRLLTMAFGTVAFIGVIIPLVSGWLQLRSLRSEKNALLKELKLELLSEREESEKKIKEEVKCQLDASSRDNELRFSKLSASLKKESAAAAAKAHHLQGIAIQSAGEDDLGLADFCHAAALFFKAEEEFNARRCINVIVTNCLPGINSKHYVDYKVQQECNNLISVIKKYNQSRRYEDDIDLIEKEMASAAAR